MGFLDFFRTEKRDNGQTFIRNAFGSGNGTGVSVDKDTALNYSAVYACVRVLSESIASLPLNVYTEERNGDRLLAKDHPIYKLISREPNKYMTSYTWREVLMANLVLRGNSYFFIDRDKNARPTAISYIDADKVQVTKYQGELYYNIKGIENPVHQSNILHFLGLGFDGCMGKSVIEVHQDTIGLSLAANKYGGNFFGNASKPSGVLKHPSKLSKEAAERLKNSWNNSYGGVSNMHRTALLEEGMDFKTVSINPQDADFLNTRKFQVNEIARIFRVPPHLIGDLERATFSNIEQQGIDFVVHTLRPYLSNIEAELNRKLFRESEKDFYYIKFNVNGLMRGDSKARAEFYKNMSLIGAMSINEIRRFEDMNKIEGGDKHYYPLNMADINTTQDGE